MTEQTKQRLTQFFQQYFQWDVPWDRIKFVENGWALKAGSLICKDNNATTIAIGNRYEIHYRPGISEQVFSHELQHIRDMERMGVVKYVIDYSTELLRVGYKRNKYEQSAIKVADLYFNTYK